MTDQKNNAQAWQIKGTALLSDDPLTNCLVILTRLFQQPVSEHTLTAGLPLEDERLTPELFVRAAARGGLAARVVRRQLHEISKLTLPAVLLLKEGQACVLVGKDEDQWRLILPESGEGEIEISQDELEEIYDGYVIFSRPSFKFDERTENYTVPKSEHWFWSVLKHSWSLYAEVLVASLLTNIFALVTPLYVMNIYDRVVPNQAFETLWVLTIGAGIVVLFDFIMKTLRAYFLDVAGKQVDVILTASIFEKVMGIKTAARPQSVGRLANNFQEFEIFRDFITSATITTLIDLPFAILFLVVITWLGGPVVLVPVLIAPIIILIALILQRPLHSIIQKTFRVASQKHATLIEALNGIDTIKMMGAEGKMQRRWEQIIGEQSQLGLKSKMLTTVIVNQAAFFQQLAYFGVVVVGVYLISDRYMTTGALIACAILTNRVLAPLAQIAGLITRYHHASNALAGVDSVMNLPQERPVGKNYVRRPEFKGAIEFREVDFTYPEQEVSALNKVSFRIEPGEHVGIIGRIGSGKSTIEKLLLGIYEPTQGSIWIDGVDMQQIDPADLRSNIGYVPQDVVLFHGSVRDNIVMAAPHVDDSAMLHAAELAGVNEFVNRHPRGFDMSVSEGGASLSGGQRQSIAVARAFLLSPPILLLDEPSSALDNRSEENLKQQIEKNMKNQTLVLVTHRASMLTMVNRLIVMDGGKVIADGPKAQVLEALSGGKVNVAKK